jgi:hypothetical protein
LQTLTWGRLSENGNRLWIWIWWRLPQLNLILWFDAKKWSWLLTHATSCKSVKWYHRLWYDREHGLRLLGNLKDIWICALLGCSQFVTVERLSDVTAGLNINFIVASVYRWRSNHTVPVNLATVFYHDKRSDWSDLSWLACQRTAWSMYFRENKTAWHHLC